MTIGWDSYQNGRCKNEYFKWFFSYQKFNEIKEVLQNDKDRKDTKKQKRKKDEKKNQGKVTNITRRTVKFLIFRFFGRPLRPTFDCRGLWDSLAYTSYLAFLKRGLSGISVLFFLWLVAIFIVTHFLGAFYSLEVSFWKISCLKKLLDQKVQVATS